MATDETYNGWTNRETWAIALHINNDQGWQESVHELLREGPYGSEGFTLSQAREAFYNAHDSIARMAGDLIRDNVEMVLDPFYGWDYGWDDANEAPMSRDVWGAVQDIGSLWRVNWAELGASFLEDMTG